MKLADLIVIEAREWLGTPYRKNGKDKTGVDCLNFCGAVFVNCRALSMMPPDLVADGFWRRPGDQILISIYSAILDGFDGGHVETVESFAELQPGDLLVVAQLPKLDKGTHALIVESVEHGAVSCIHARSRGAVERLPTLPPHWRFHAALRVFD